MQRQVTFAFVLAAAALCSFASRAEAQATADQCPPGQPCVVVVPQPPPAQGQVIVQQPQPSSAYVTVQPAPQPGVTAYGAPQPQPREVRHSRMRWGMIVPGIILTVVGWVANWITAIPGAIEMDLDDVNPDAGRYFGWQWVPWIGPFVGAGYWAGTSYDGYFGVHLLWGIMQTSGLLLCILGTVLTEEEVTYEYALGDAPDAPRLAVTPFASESSGGLSARLTF
ncbi:hypothetical protein [Sandaracinus amylolyticus]|uniref:hypothetical protein n=1 Tax=Sandaracinus amylolyticus TaxID=927083 RepID=UPI00069FC340|nr:hypothetical protein [Sandaracinus amylolyticus]